MLTQKELQHMAESDPRNLVALIESETLGHVELTFAAEYLSAAIEAEGVVPCLLALLKHNAAVVREGALYGLAEAGSKPGVREAVAEVSRSDGHKALQHIAEGILLDFDEN